MRRLLICTLLLTGCAVPGSFHHAFRPVAPQEPPVMQLQRAVHALAEADDRRPLDVFIDAHADDEWGSLARKFSTLHDEAVQLDKQNRALAAEKQTLSQQNQAQQKQLQALQSKLEELTRSLIEQEKRQP